MQRSPQLRRRYDHRIRDAVIDGRELALVQKLAIPASTTRSLRRRGAAPVVALHPRDSELRELEVRIAWLERRSARLLALVRLLIALVRVTGARLDDTRLPQRAGKERLLRAIADAGEVVGRASVRRLTGLTDGRLRAWRRRESACALDDAPPCPHTVPHRLTRDERSAIRGLVLDERYRHLTIGSLALLAARTGRVFASARTWCSLIRKNGWRRPRARVYPQKPTEGVRASHPNEWWHVDVTVVRLLDGTRAYVHGVIDNYSRKLLAWRVEPKLRAETTRAILLEARTAVDAGSKVKVLTDGGSENLIIAADADLTAVAQHVVAQVAVHFSNSMIEAFWKQLRHQWLYLHALDSIATLRRLVGEYVADHNALIPREHLGGRTPGEAYAGIEPPSLVAGQAAARRARVEANRATRCATCTTGTGAMRVVP